MLLGTNVTSAANLRDGERFFAAGLVDFHELLIDNFVHLDPNAVARRLADRPVGLHIMVSRFLDRDRDELARLGNRLRRFVRTLRPIYVSDHLGHYEVDGRLLPELVEVDYNDRSLFTAIARWQDMLACTLLLENFPSGSDNGRGQVEFFEELTRQVPVLPLFDLSNAVIAEKNGGAVTEDWLCSSLPLSACHISGYRTSAVDPDLLIDSHDCAIAEDSWRFLSETLSRRGAPDTLVVERDVQGDTENWAADLRQARRLCLTESRP
jgi:uncharacterized protein